MAVQETLDSLKIILEDESTFQLVVDRVFADLDVNCNNTLDTAEFQAYISRCCAAMNIRDVPNHEQIAHVFKHLDLDNDKYVTKDELAVFLRHLFREQLKHCADKLRTLKPTGKGAHGATGQHGLASKHSEAHPAVAGSERQHSPQKNSLL